MFAQDHGEGGTAEARSTAPAVMELMLRLGAIRDFGAACREMIDLVERQIVSEDRRTAEEIAAGDPFADGASSDERALVHKLFADIERDVAEAVDAVTDADLDRVRHVGDPYAALLSLIPFDRLRVRLIRLADGELASMPGSVGYAAAYIAALMRRPRQPLLLRALLAAVCSRVEAEVASVLRRALYSKGGSSRYDSAELDEAVQAHLRGGLAKWRKVLVAELNIDLQALSVEWPSCEEVFLRRNLVVHRGGIVDSTYQQKADPSAAIGTHLDVDPAYLNRAVDLTETLTFALAATYLLIHQPDLSTRLSGAASELGEDAARRGRMLLAQGYHHVAGSLTHDPIERARARVECWLDQDGRVDPSSMRDEVLEWDTSDLPPEFELARQILLGEDEPALELIDHLRETNHITDEDIAGWRLLRSLRDRGLTPTPASIPSSDEARPADVDGSG